MKDKFTATLYTDEKGNVIDSLEENVTGKKYWLETTKPMTSKIYATDTDDGITITMENECIKRVFAVSGGFRTTSYTNEFTCASLLSGESPEALLGLYPLAYRKIYSGEAINVSPTYFTVGGEKSPNSFVMNGYEIFDKCEEPFHWTPNKIYGDSSSSPFPPKGKRLEVSFEAQKDFPKEFQGVHIKIIYEIYDNLATIKKRVEVTNDGSNVITIGKMATDIFEVRDENKSLLMLETSYTGGHDGTIPFNVALPCGCKNESTDSPFSPLKDKLHACYEIGPAYQLEQKGKFISFDTFELFYSTYWFEQRGMERLAMYRKLFPWITDSPIIFHCKKPITKKVIDKASLAGFDMVVQSFGVKDKSKEMLSNKPKVMKYYKELVDYAHSKNVCLGIYQAQYLLSKYKKSAQTNKNNLGTWNTWCLAAEGFDDYFESFLKFLKYTGMDCVEIDGPYPNCPCDNGEKHKNTENATHAVHQGYHDSVVKQWENAVRLLCIELRNLGVYIQVPAWYYANGANRCGIGYEEEAWSQPRDEQLIYARQIFHNASYARTMTMSWSHIPFSVYHRGGKDAAYIPFKKNIAQYDWILAQCLGNGITGVFRGKELFDKETLPIAKKWTSFYQLHKGIANGEIVHIKQAKNKSDSQRSRTNGIDVLFHASANNPVEKGLLWVYNQTDDAVSENIDVPMYYTGLTDLPYPQPPVPKSMGKDVRKYGKFIPNYDWLPKDSFEYTLPDITGDLSGNCTFTDETGNYQILPIDSNGYAHLKVMLAPMSYTYFIVTKA